jgi:hypothetical protein
MADNQESREERLHDPNQAPMFFMEAIVDPKPPGSRLDADHPENGVLIPCLLTLEQSRLTRFLMIPARRSRSLVLQDYGNWSITCPRLLLQPRSNSGCGKYPQT